MPLWSQPLQQPLPGEVLVADGQQAVLVGDVERLAGDTRDVQRGPSVRGEHGHRPGDEPDPEPAHVVKVQARRSLNGPLRHPTRPSRLLTRHTHTIYLIPPKSRHIAPTRPPPSASSRFRPPALPASASASACAAASFRFHPGTSTPLQ